MHVFGAHAVTTRTYGGNHIAVGKTLIGTTHVMGPKSMVRIGGPPVACSFGILRTVRGHVKTGLIPRVVRGIAAPSRCRLLRVDGVDNFVSQTQKAKHPAGGSQQGLRRFAAPRFVSSFSFRFSFSDRSWPGWHLDGISFIACYRFERRLRGTHFVGGQSRGAAKWSIPRVAACEFTLATSVGS